MAKPILFILVGLVRNACFLCPALENFMNWGDGTGPNAPMIPAGSGPPEWLAGLPKGVFARDTKILQQSVV